MDIEAKVDLILLFLCSHQLKQMEPTLHKNTEYDEFINISLPDCIEQSARECDPQAGDITDSQLAYFCGQGIECVKWNSPNSIKQAKLNVDKYFPVVAVLEYIDESLFVLERMLPRYFTHATDVFKGSKCYIYCGLHFRSITCKIILHPYFKS